MPAAVAVRPGTLREASGQRVTRTATGSRPRRIAGSVAVAIGVLAGIAVTAVALEGGHGGAPRQQADLVTVDRAPQRSRHLLGLGVGAGGMAVVGVGIALGLEARSKWGSVGTHCDANHLCDAMGVPINHDARLRGHAGTIVGGVGLAALITGTVLYMTAPAARPVIEHAHLEAGEGSSVQIRFGGRF